MTTVFAMTAKPSLRERNAERTRRRIVDDAAALFVAQGFDATTIDEIAERAEVSPRTFFRYFPTKEAVLFHDLDNRLDTIVSAIENRPAGEAAATTFIEVLKESAAGVTPDSPEAKLLRRLLESRPSLRAYQRSTIAEHCSGAIVGALARNADLDPDDVGLQAMLASVGACFDIAIRNWVLDETPRPFPEVFDETLSACSAAMPQPAVST